MEKEVELFDKKFVHFMWDDELEGKECFVADNIDDLIFAVRNDGKCGVKTNVLQPSSRASLPFLVSLFGNCYPFAYYDPNYEAKKAFNEGKEIQFKDDVTGKWCHAYNPRWDLNIEYRVKPEEDLYVAFVDHYEPHLDFGSCAQWDKIQEYKGAKNKLFIGSNEECRAWCDSHDKFAEEILAWENGKELQFRPNDNHLSWQECANPSWDSTLQYRVKPNGLVWTDLKMGDILRRAGERPAPLGGRDEYVYVEERRMVTGIVDDPGTKRHVQLGGDWIDDEDLGKWSVEE